MRFASALLLASTTLSAAVLFEPNRGQAPDRARFIAHAPGGLLGIDARSVELCRRDGTRVFMTLAGGRRDARAIPERRAPGVSHYALGADPGRWIWDVPRYAQVRYGDVYPGIDIAYHAARGELEFDFLVSPGADPSRIALGFSEPLHLGPSGELVSGMATLRPPAAWQTIDGAHVPVDVAFSVSGRATASFRIGRYDRSRPLTIDPVILMASYLGGSDNEGDSRIVIGSDGALYMAGTTASADFPAVLPPGALLNRPEILLAPDAYVTRLRADGSAQDWSLFLGGNAAELALGLRLDSLGNLYVLGTTSSPNFPVTPGAYQPAIHPFLTDLFLVKLDAQTGRIKASTFLAAPGGTAVLAVDPAGGVYVAGNENDAAFKTTPGAYQGGPGSPTSNFSHTFVLRINAALTGLVYATFFDSAAITAIDVDDNGSAVVGGIVNRFPSPGAPGFEPVNPIPGVDQKTIGQAFVARLNPTGTALVFATEIHGDGNFSSVSDVRVAADGTIHVLGYSGAGGFPQVNAVPIDPPPPANPSTDPYPFWVKLPPAGGAPIQSTVFLGPQFSTAPALAFPATLRLAFLAGGQTCFLNTGSSQLQQTPGGLIGRASDFDSLQYGGSLVCVNSRATAIGTKTLLPAFAAYSAAAAAPDGTVLLTGTAQPSFTTTPGVMQRQFGGGASHDQFYPYSLGFADAFFLRLSLDNPVPKVASVIPESMVLTTNISGTATVDVFGSGFAAGIAATLNGRPAATRFVDTGHIVLSNLDYAAIQPGPNRIAVSLSAPGGGASEATLTGISPTPSIVSVSPATVTQGSPDTKVVVRALNLGANSTLYWNGQPRAAQFVADLQPRAGHFEVVLPAAELGAPASVRVAVGNPAPGGGLSPDAVFAVQPAAGDGQPTVTSFANPVLFAGPVPPGPKLTLGGSGFSASTRAFWDGAEVAVEFVSATRINITAPAADLSRWGAHDVYVANGAYRSPTVRQFVARAINGCTFAASDPAARRLYLGTSQCGAQAPADLAILDLRTGALLSTVTGILPTISAVVAGAGGRYVYLAGGSPSGKIARYDTNAGAVDLQWDIDLASTTQGLTASVLLPVPGSPESVIVWTASQGVVIYDRDRPRFSSAEGAGFAATDVPAFATASRIYLQPTNGYCWRWMEYDAFGISGGATACAADPGPDALHDGGFVFLADGQRAYVVSVPANTFAGSSSPAAFLADLPRRRVIQAGASQIVELNLDTEQQTVKGSMNLSFPGLLNGADGAVIVMTSAWIGMVP